MARAPFQVLVLPWRPRAQALEVAVFHRADYDLWQFVSGGGEDTETPLETARREGFEEAGIPRDAPYLALEAMTMLPACWYREWTTWPPHVLVIPEHAFGVEVTDVQRSAEHRDVCWLAVPAAMERLSFDSNRHALWELNERIFPGPRVKRFVYSRDPWRR
jgi:dATP pyrophosphohydrolase